MDIPAEQEYSLKSISGALEQKLSAWFRAESRDLPWRRTDDPYAIWVSEIMLQQTQVETVIPYYSRFLELFPAVGILAEANEDEVLKAWEGLGYYRRARMLHAGSRYVVSNHGGKLPETEAELLKIPGLGKYTAAAILAFAFEKRAAAIDGNSFRVLSRLLAAPWEIGRAKDQTKARAELFAIITDANSHVMNEGLIELGARICRPRPDCPACPVKGECGAFAKDAVMDYPLAKASREVPVERWTFFILRDSTDRILLEQRPNKGLLAGLWQFPGLPGHASPVEWQSVLNDAGLVLREPPKMVSGRRHVFSHRIWQMEIMEAALTEAAEAPPSHLQFEEGGSPASSWLGEGSLSLLPLDSLRALTFSSALSDIRDQLI